MAVTAAKTFGVEVLLAADLNAEFNNVLDSGQDLGWVSTQAKDMDGNPLQFDTDRDTNIGASTDDRLDFFLSEKLLFQVDGTVASPVTYIEIRMALSGSNGQIQAQGLGESNVSLNLVPRGTGSVVISGADSLGGVETDDRILAHTYVYGR